MDIMEIVAGLMELSARTAPKASGQDYVESKILTGDILDQLADEMAKFGQEVKKVNFDRDGNNVRNSDAVLLLSLKEPRDAGLNCGACGYEDCISYRSAGKKEGPEFKGPICAWRLLDLGIALGSAVKTASILNTDNRIMYRVGVVARKMGLIEGDIVVGIPISATGKSIYFDRKN